MESSLRTVDRALDLLLFVCDSTGRSTGHTLAECAKYSELPASTALRILRSLTARGFVTRDEEGLFHPGAALIQIGAQVLSSDNLLRIARPSMQELVAGINESTYLLVRNHEGDCLYIGIEECTRNIRHVSWVGNTIPFEGSAAGQAMSGTLKAGEYTFEKGTIEPDVVAIATPIIAGDMPVAALSILAPSYRITDDDIDRFGPQLAATGLGISSQIS